MGKVVLALLHGYNSTPLSMKGIEHEFRNWDGVEFAQILNLSLYGLKWGFLPSKYSNSTPIINVNDGSTSIEGTLVEHLLDQLKEQVIEDVDEIIFLGHSMGGLVWRTLYKAVIHEDPDNWLDKPSPKVLGIIQLATPNQGSKLTNMRLIEYFDKIHTSVILNIAGFSARLINRLADFIGLKERIEDENFNADEQTTQLKQMKPGSKFLKWLNSEPTYVDEIPHYRAIGTKNSVFFTNLAWVDDHGNISNEMVFEGLVLEDDDLTEKQIETIITNIEESQFSDDYDIKELKEFLENKEDMQNGDNYDRPFLDQLRSLFDDTEFEDNDGLVSLRDSELPGSILIDLDEHGRKISHYSIVMWFLPIRSYQYVRDQVFTIIKTDLLD